MIETRSAKTVRQKEQISQTVDHVKNIYRYIRGKEKDKNRERKKGEEPERNIGKNSLGIS